MKTVPSPRGSVPRRSVQHTGTASWALRSFCPLPPFFSVRRDYLSATPNPATFYRRCLVSRSRTLDVGTPTQYAAGTSFARGVVVLPGNPRLSLRCRWPHRGRQYCACEARACVGAFSRSGRSRPSSCRGQLNPASGSRFWRSRLAFTQWPELRWPMAPVRGIDAAKRHQPGNALRASDELTVSADELAPPSGGPIRVSVGRGAGYGCCRATRRMTRASGLRRRVPAAPPVQGCPLQIAALVRRRP